MTELNIIDEIMSKNSVFDGRGPRSGSFKREFGPDEDLR